MTENEQRTRTLERLGIWKDHDDWEDQLLEIYGNRSIGDRLVIESDSSKAELRRDYEVIGHVWNVTFLTDSGPVHYMMVAGGLVSVRSKDKGFTETPGISEAFVGRFKENAERWDIGNEEYYELLMDFPDGVEDELVDEARGITGYLRSMVGEKEEK